jgi:hypothetical protein
MSILADSNRIVLDINQVNVYGDKGVGVYQLIFHTNFFIKSWKEKECLIRDLKAEVNIKDHDNSYHFLGIASPKEAFVTKTFPESDIESDLNLVLLLYPHQVELIEKIRNSQDFFFKLKYSAETHARSLEDQANSVNSRTDAEEKTIPITQSTWINCLESMGYGKYLLFEVPIPEAIDGRISKNIFNELKSSQQHFFQGHYNVTVSKCRNVLELLEKLLSDNNSISKSMNQFLESKSRTKMNKEDRFYFIRKAVYHFTHLAHHSEERGNITHFNRIEAQQILSITTSVLSYFLNEYE